MDNARTSQVAHCPDYNEAKHHVKKASKLHAFVWLEAEKLSADALVWPPRPNSVAYSVHASRFLADVPDFAIEVYERGALSRYETSNEVIHQRAQMNQTDRILALRSRQSATDAALARRAKEHLAAAQRRP